MDGLCHFVLNLSTPFLLALLRAAWLDTVLARY